MLICFSEIAFPRRVRKENCYQASVNPEFDLTLARRLNQSLFPAVLRRTKLQFRSARQKLNWWIVSQKLKHFMSYFGYRHSAINLTPSFQIHHLAVFFVKLGKGFGKRNSNLDSVGTKTIENETATERYKDGK